MKEPLKETLQMDAEHIPPKNINWPKLYKGFLRMRASRAALAEDTEITSWMTCKTSITLNTNMDTQSYIPV